MKAGARAGVQRRIENPGVLSQVPETSTFRNCSSVQDDPLHHVHSYGAKAEIHKRTVDDISFLAGIAIPHLFLCGLEYPPATGFMSAKLA